jgi:sigma-B regulation protein RsbU (phosphoserine phosphatase)
MLSRRLQRQGMKVEIATDGRQALELVRNRPFDVVLLNTMMPELDGFRVLQQMKADPQTRHIPVIMISAVDELDRCHSLHRSRRGGLPAEPFNPILLRARISACLEKKSLREAEQQHLSTIEETQHRLAAELAEAAHYVRSIFPPPSATPLRIDWKYQPPRNWAAMRSVTIGLTRITSRFTCSTSAATASARPLLSVTAINVIRSGSLAKTISATRRGALGAK